MTDYETMARIREREDRVRGYSIMGAGPITHIDNRPIQQLITSIKRSNNPKIFEGLACVYNKAHMYKGRVEVFAKGCFDHSLSTKSLVRFFIDHKHDETPLGDSDSNLELVESDVGLGFRLKLSEANQSRLNGRDSMSVCYTENDVEIRRIDDEDVRFIKSASLIEISACYRGAVRQAYAVVRDASKTGALRDDVKNSFPSEAAAKAFTRALSKLQQ